MNTITSPEGRVHLIMAHEATYRGAHEPTTTWCGIRATRTWSGGDAEPTCGSCERRHGASTGPDAAGPPSDGTAAGEDAPGTDASNGRGDLPPPDGTARRPGSPPADVPRPEDVAVLRPDASVRRGDLVRVDGPLRRADVATRLRSVDWTEVRNGRRSR